MVTKDYKFEIKPSPVMHAQKLGPQSSLRLLLEESGQRHWWLDFSSAKGKDSLAVELPDLGGQDALLGIAKQLQEHGAAVERLLRALVSIGRRPTDYGLSREEMEAMREASNPAPLARYMIDRSIGKAKISLSGAEFNEATAALIDCRVAGVEAGQDIWRACAGRQEEKVLGCRLPKDVYEHLQREAIFRLMTPGQFVRLLLQERYAGAQKPII